MEEPHRIYRTSLKLMVAVLVMATLGPTGSALADFTQPAQPINVNAVVTSKVQPTGKSQAAQPQDKAKQDVVTSQPEGKLPTGSTVPSVTPQKDTESGAPKTAPVPTTGRIKVSNALSATEMAAQVKNGKIDPATLIKQTYERIATVNPALNSVIYQDEDNAMAQLKALNNTTGGKELPFYGVPLLIKGLGQPYKGWPDTNGLTFERNHKSVFTKSFVSQLQKLGFVIVGQTNFPELGLLNVTTSLLNGDAHNPWDLTRNPGGSSGGSAAAVSAGIVPVATGNDAGGSLRIPASWSGVIGFKPTQGMILGDPTSPSVVNFAESRSIEDTIGLLKGLMNPKHVSGLQPVPQELNQLKVAYSMVSPVGTPVSKEAKQAVLQAAAFLKKHGFTVTEQAAPVDGVKLMQTYYLEALGDGSVANYLAQMYMKHKLTAADVTNGVISPITYALYLASQKEPTNTRQEFKAELALVKDQMTKFHQEYPIYLTPTTATVAPKNSDPNVLPEMEAKLAQIGQLKFPDQMKLIYDAWLHGLTKTPFTQLANLAGEPALSLPTYVSPAGLPLGIQLQGAPGSDFTLLALGKLFESHHQFKFLSDQQPPVTSHPVLTTKPRHPIDVPAPKRVPFSISPMGHLRLGQAPSVPPIRPRLQITTPTPVAINKLPVEPKRPVVTTKVPSVAKTHVGADTNRLPMVPQYHTQTNTLRHPIDTSVSAVGPNTSGKIQQKSVVTPKNTLTMGASVTNTANAQVPTTTLATPEGTRTKDSVILNKALSLKTSAPTTKRLPQTGNDEGILLAGVGLAILGGFGLATGFLKDKRS